ncbi:MAG: tRNA-wybutosine modification methyltransferase TYW3 [Petrotogales bacterium]
MVKKEFLDAKEKALLSLQKACSEKKTDKEILPILRLINDCEGCYTSSSCAGRIVLLEIPRIGDKKRAKFLGKWHRTIKPDEVKTAAKKARSGLLWLLAQSPIIHIVVATSEMADKLVKTAVASGFKHSGIKSIGRKIVVEVCSTERLDAPIGKHGFLFCNEEYLQMLVKISNEIFEVSKKKILRFEKELKKI